MDSAPALAVDSAPALIRTRSASMPWPPTRIDSPPRLTWFCPARVLPGNALADHGVPQSAPASTATPPAKRLPGWLKSTEPPPTACKPSRLPAKVCTLLLADCCNTLSAIARCLPLIGSTAAASLAVAVSGV